MIKWRPLHSETPAFYKRRLLSAHKIAILVYVKEEKWFVYIYYSSCYPFNLYCDHCF